MGCGSSNAATNSPNPAKNNPNPLSLKDPADVPRPTTPATPKSPLPEKELGESRNTSTHEMRLAALLKNKRGNVYSQGVKAGFELTKIPKTPEETDFLVTALKKLYLFSNLNPSDLVGICESMSIDTYPKDHNLIIQGQDGDYFYIVQTGSVNILVDGKYITSLGVGDAFGELALMNNSARAATVQAAEEVTCYKCDRDSFIFTMARENEQRSTEVKESLSQVKLLEGLNDDQLTRLAEFVAIGQHPPGENIITKGEISDIFYMIKKGTVKVTDIGEGFENKELSVGDYFGDRALVTGEPRKATVISLTDVTLMVLDRTTFTECLGPVGDLIDQNNNLRILMAIAMLSKLPKEDLMNIASSMKSKNFTGGEVIIREGDEGDMFYILKEGDCDVLKGTVPLGTLHAGASFGEMALINNEKRNATIVATTDCICFQIDRATFTSILDEHRVIGDEYVRKRKDEMNQAIATSIPFSNLKTIGLLGTGTFGRVTLVHDKQSAGIYALKALVKSHVVKMGQVTNVHNERTMMSLLSDCPFILKLYQTYQDAGRLYMLLEFVQGGELFSVLHNAKRDGISDGEAKFYAAGVAEALAYMHKRKISYRDMKPENCLIDKDGYPKLVDFGFAKIITTKSYTLCGTPEYLAPEIVLGRGHNCAVDYWSFGILCYEMQAGNSPFADPSFDQNKIFKNITNNKLKFPSSMNEEFKDFVRRLLHSDPLKRMGNRRDGPNEIRKHSWLSKLNFDSYRQKKIRAPWTPKLKGDMDTSRFNTSGLESDHMDIDTSVPMDGIVWSF